MSNLLVATCVLNSIDEVVANVRTHFLSVITNFDPRVFVGIPKFLDTSCNLIDIGSECTFNDFTPCFCHSPHAFESVNDKINSKLEHLPRAFEVVFYVFNTSTKYLRLIVEVDEVVNDLDSIIDNLRQGLHSEYLSLHGDFVEAILAQSEELRHLLIKFCLRFHLLTL